MIFSRNVQCKYYKFLRVKELTSLMTYIRIYTLRFAISSYTASIRLMSMVEYGNGMYEKKLLPISPLLSIYLDVDFVWRRQIVICC